MGRLFKSKFANKIIENLLVFLMRLIYLSCKKEFITNTLPNKPVVILFWHEKLAFMPFIFTKCWSGREANVIISDHKDGQMITDIIAHFGIGSIRGSSSKGALRAFLLAIKSINNGIDVAITPDGPRGPRHSISDGSVTIAQKTGVNIVKGFKAALTAVEVAGGAAAPETLGVSLVATVICFMIDAVLDEFFEWFSNKNVCTLLPLWWENYPFVSGVKDGEKILIMKSNSTATGENTRSDAIDVESNND